MTQPSAFRDAPNAVAAGGATLATLYAEWRDVEREIALYAGSAGHAHEAALDALTDRESGLVERMAAIRAGSIGDVHLKMLVWRESAPGVSSPSEDLEPHEILAHSVCADVAALVACEDKVPKDAL